MYIGIEKRSDTGAEYASVYTTERVGKKVKKRKIRYLGKVLDKEKGIFQNRELGVYTYDINTDTIGKISPNYEVPVILRKNAVIPRKSLWVSFGDVYLYHKYMEKIKFLPVVDAINYGNNDTLQSLLAYYILSKDPNVMANEWFEISYIKFLYPNAHLESQRISEALEDIGEEEAKRDFFNAYFEYLGISKGTDEEKANIEQALKLDGTGKELKLEGAVLIDSTGLPNATKMPVTAVNNHNGVVSLEARLIYVVQQDSGIPLYYRYVSGNVVDSTTLTRTVDQMNLMGIDIEWALVDAGYYNGINADAFYDRNVNFLTRVEKSAVIFKQAVKDHGEELYHSENMVAHNNRLFYVIEVKVKIGKNKDKPAFAYLCLDSTERYSGQMKTLGKNPVEGYITPEIAEKMKTSGMFMLISNKQIPKDKVLPLYYTRDQVEKIFEIGKQQGKLLPIFVQSEASFRGHLLMTFIATLIWKKISDEFKGYELSAKNAFSLLGRLPLLLYPDQKIMQVGDPTRLYKLAFKILGVEMPYRLPMP